MKDIRIGGIPANHKFSGNGLIPGKKKMWNCQAPPTVKATLMRTAVTGPMLLTRPEVLLGKRLFSEVKLADLSIGLNLLLRT